ncbi:MAG: hypothetical protein IJ583_05615, partial [Firmicutes bacterium]|nr:hypothetical protein [Bacillota bacterium]
MSYVSYVAQSKARDEIVNNITYQISQQKQAIESIIGYISTIEALINADDEKIGEISAILKDYTEKVAAILNEKFTEKDLDILEQGSLLKLCNGDYKSFMDYQSGIIEKICSRNLVTEKLYGRVLTKIWERINGTTGYIDGHKIDNLFKKDDFYEIVSDMINKMKNDGVINIRDTLNIISDDVKKIAMYRQEKLRIESDRCRERLEKEHYISIDLPSMPEFEFSAAV